MARPVPGTVAAEILDALAPMLYNDDGDSLATYLTSISNVLFQEVEDLASDDPVTGAIGWSAIVDLNRAPAKALPWLAQFVGVSVDKGLSESQQRQQISDAANWKRGTVQAMKDAPKPFLTGTKTVIFRERFGGPGFLTVITYTNETNTDDRPTTNLFKNGGAESNLDYLSWTPGAFDSTLTRQSGGAKFGAWAYKLYSNLFVSPEFIFLRNDAIATTRIPVTAGLPYSLSAWFKHDNVWYSENFNMGMRFYDGGGSLIEDDNMATLVAASDMFVDELGRDPFSTPPDFVVEPNIWYRSKFTWAAPVGAVSVDPYLQIDIGGAGAVNTLIDGIQFEQTNIPSEYIETNGSIVTRLGNGPVRKALMAAKPAGIILNYEVRDGQDYESLRNTHATYALIYSDYLTYYGIISDQPGV